MTSSRAEEYLALAESYVEAARRLSPHAESISRPFNMLVAHALELSLKALLSHRGYDEEQLMMRGHTLARCQDHAEGAGFTGLAASEVRALIVALDAPHTAQTFRYPSRLYASPLLHGRGVYGTLAAHLRDVRLFLQEGVR